MARIAGSELTTKGISKKKQRPVDTEQPGIDVKESKQFPKIVKEGIAQNQEVSQGE